MKPPQNHANSVEENRGQALGKPGICDEIIDALAVIAR